MKTSINLWDALFGERLTLDLPLSDGTTKKVSVTKAWWEEMKKQGKVKDATSPIVTVNILDPGLHVSPDCDDIDKLMESLTEETPLIKVEHWKIGVQVPRQQYEQFLDPNSKELYALRKMENGEIRTLLVQRKLWEQTRRHMENL